MSVVNGFQRKVIKLMSDGLLDRQVSKELGVPIYKIKYNIDLVKKTWNCKNKAHLVATAIRKGEIQ